MKSVAGAFTRVALSPADSAGWPAGERPPPAEAEHGTSRSRGRCQPRARGASASARCCAQVADARAATGASRGGGRQLTCGHASAMRGAATGPSRSACCLAAGRTGGPDRCASARVGVVHVTSSRRPIIGGSDSQSSHPVACTTAP